MENQVVNQPTYYQLNKEKRLAYQKQYNEQHKQQLKDYQHAYWIKNKHKKVKRPVVYHPRPKKEKKPKPPKAPVLPPIETIIEQLTPPPLPIQSNIEIINTPIVVRFL